MFNQQESSKVSVKRTAKLDVKTALSNTILQESFALTNVSSNIPDSAVILVNKILNFSGKVIFSGVGKSGLIGQKLAATFSSLGIPSIFLHACDALHGDLGVVQLNDIFVALSKSATGTELESIFTYLNSLKIFTTLISCCEGDLCKFADLIIKLPLEREACTLNLAPTSSSTLMMAFGDALAVVISSLKDFNKDCFARFHPAGTLGRRLTLTAGYFMYSGQNLPLLCVDARFSDILYIISSKKLGMGVVVDKQKHLLGLITDGDLRRACDKFGPEVFTKTAFEIMSGDPKSIGVNNLAYKALEIMEVYNITSLVVIENEIVVGVVHIHDLVKAGIKG